MADATLAPQPSAFALRAATAADLDLAYEITVEAMRSCVELTWGRWDESEQRKKHRDNYTPTTHRVVLVDGVEAGLVATEIEPAHLWLVKLYLRCAFRGRGLGSELLRRVLAEADAHARPTRLRVLRVNTRAQSLYLRHGFHVVGDTPERLLMLRPLAGAG